MRRWIAAVAVLLLVFVAGSSFGAGLKGGEGITQKSRCPVCGMFVAKYQQWLTQINMSDGSTEFFDGVKDMMAYYFSPQQFGAPKGAMPEEVLVKTYYSQQWVDANSALFVLGSDVYGPMGHELIPFAGQAEADNFFKDHHGSKIFNFSEITPDVIEALRKGHKMKGHK